MRPIEALPSQPAELLPIFQRLLPTSVLMAMVQSTPQRFYQRIFGPLVLIWGFIHQQLSSDHSCDGVLSHLASGVLDEWEAAQTASPRSVSLSQRVPRHNSSYCQGRQRLPLSLLRQCLKVTAHTLHEEAKASFDWLGRTVLLLDGSTLLTQATPALIEHYGRHTNQHGAGHWPVLHCVAAFDLHTGAVTEIVEGTMHASEQRLAIELFRQTATPMGAESGLTERTLPEEPRIYVADRNFGIFLIAQVAVACGQDVVVRLTESRVRALLRRNGQRELRPGEEMEMEWQSSPQDLTLSRVAPDAEFPQPVPPAVRGRLLYWRLERSGYRPVDLYLFTTLLDQERYPAADVIELYGWRWHVEINLRYVKSTLGLAQLQAKSVEMARKELVAGLLAYNLIRGLMALAAMQAQLSPLELSFQRCWRRLQSMVSGWPAQATSQETAERLSNLLKMLGYCTLYRSKKKRSAARAIRGRPTAYPFLKGERLQIYPEGIKS